ncbi:MAG: ATP-binding protein, partial [Thermoplasmata archaeon]|nr:ATP-binding protein [Thermoplasmata archaeon]
MPGPAFIGREEQLGRLGEAYQKVHEREGWTLFVFGESGSGKTGLVRRFAEMNDIPLYAYSYQRLERRPFTACIPL